MQFVQLSGVTAGILQRPSNSLWVGDLCIHHLYNLYQSYCAVKRTWTFFSEWWELLLLFFTVTRIRVKWCFFFADLVIVLPKFQLGLQSESLNFDLVGLQKCSGQLNCFSTNTTTLCTEIHHFYFTHTFIWARFCFLSNIHTLMNSNPGFSVLPKDILVCRQ